jgi:hypothetical protein
MYIEDLLNIGRNLLKKAAKLMGFSLALKIYTEIDN